MKVEENVAAAAVEAVAASTAEDQRDSRGQRIQTKSLLAMKRGLVVFCLREYRHVAPTGWIYI